MSDSKPPRKLRSNPNSFLYGVRWQIDMDYLKKLSPEDREWMLRFMEVEVGNNPDLMYEGNDDERHRCFNSVKRQQNDVMNGALHGIPIDSLEMSNSPEDAIIELIDGRHIVRQLEVEADAWLERHKKNPPPAPPAKRRRAKKPKPQALKKKRKAIKCANS